MNRDDGDNQPEARTAHWTKTPDPQKVERERELLDRIAHSEIMTEDAICGFSEAPPPATEREIMRLCELSEAEFRHISRLKPLRQKFHIDGILWNRWVVFIIPEMRSVLLRGFRSQSDMKRETAERARQKAEKVAARQASELNRDGTPYGKSAEERAKIGERTRAAWERRRAGLPSLAEQRRQAGLKKNGSTFKRTAEERARMSAGLKESWARRRAQGGKLAD